MSYSNDLPPLGPYSGQSLEELLALEGTSRVDTIVMAIAWPLSERTRAQEALTEAERTVVMVEQLHTDAYNAGLDGFFTNSWADFSGTIAALKAISRDDAAGLLAEALTALGANPKTDHDDILDALEDEAVEEQLDELDRRYTALAWSVTTSLFEYIKTNASQIRLK